MERPCAVSKAVPVVTKLTKYNYCLRERPLKTDLAWSHCRKQRWLNKHHEYSCSGGGSSSSSSNIECSAIEVYLYVLHKFAIVACFASLNVVIIIKTTTYFCF